jgi:hypothetical protein
MVRPAPYQSKRPWTTGPLVVWIIVSFSENPPDESAADTEKLRNTIEARSAVPCIFTLWASYPARDFTGENRNRQS